jgi:hypothetical protein
LRPPLSRQNREDTSYRSMITGRLYLFSWQTSGRRPGPAPRMLLLACCGA